MPPSDENLILTEEKIGFDAGELIACSKCGRTNAPNRLKCMYCAAELDVPESIKQHVQLRQTRPEAWENGFNVICLRVPEMPPELTETARSTGIEEEFLTKAIQGELPLPIARVGSGAEAKTIAERLAANGIETSIADDKTLDAYRPRRVRAIEIDEDSLTFVLFNSDEVIRVNQGDIGLIVAGKYFENEVQTTELRKFRKGELEDQILSNSKSSVIDVYTNEEAFRIHEHGFDFSCLGDEKTLVAADNIEKLIEMIRRIASNAEYDARYEQTRELLGTVWAMDEAQEAGGVSRSGFGKLLVSRSTRQTNKTQFNRYSAMLRHLR